MGYLSARLFTWVAGADFYRLFHEEAVHTLPVGRGKSWLDVGCGPGLLVRLAEERGYEAIGVDSDLSMIRVARNNSRSKRSRTLFEVGNISDFPELNADVVSASSLLAVVPDKKKMLCALWGRVIPGGTLLFIETTSDMTLFAFKKVRNALPQKRLCALWLWSMVRGGRSIDAKIFETLPYESASYTPLLFGLVGVWRFKKAIS